MISTHILDTSSGAPAAGVEVSLEIREDEAWFKLDTQKTNTDGRAVFTCPYKIGVYRILFKTSEYFEKNNIDFFFLKTPVIFRVKDISRKYHVPLLLNPFGYSVYRGS